MQIYGVSFDMVGKQPIVLLKTTEGNRFLPIWIGHPEAAAILMKLQGASTPRPMTHDLLIEMLEQLDAKCERVSVTELRDNTFYASITISVNGSEIEIDSRPSDAIALAVRCQAPIFAAEDVIEESSIEFEHEVEDTDEVVEKFKNFLDEVTPGGLRRRRPVGAPVPGRCHWHRHGYLRRWGRMVSLMGQKLPPGPRTPSLFQGAGMWTRPISWLERNRAKYGNRFTTRFPFTPPFVVIADPEQVKEIFTAPPDVLMPGVGARVLCRSSARNSVLLLDGDAHMCQRKLMLPAFHGERMERLTDLVAQRDRATRSRRGAPARWSFTRAFSRSLSRSSCGRSSASSRARASTPFARASRRSSPTATTRSRFCRRRRTQRAWS